MMENYRNIDEDRNEIQRNFNKEEAYIRAKKKLEKLKGFYWHLGVYIVVNTFIILIVYWNLGEHKTFWQFGTFVTPIFWGIGLLFHFLGVFVPHLLFGKDWEDKKIKEFMDRDKQHWQ